MATITTIAATDIISESRAVINTNFNNLNSAKLETSDLTAYLTESEADLLYAPISHTHVISNVTGLQDALDGKQPIATVLTNTTASFTTALKDKLDGIASGAEVNVQADWNAVDGDAFIQNKPTLFSGSYDDLTDKPTLFSGAYADLSGTPTLGNLAALDTITNTEVIDGALSIAKTSGLQAALNDKLESTDIADFETTTELNARDTANRSRSNHTGSQAISTVTGLQDALDDKLEAADLIPYETESELDARDTANRNRANHTGTQAQSTIVDLVTDLAEKLEASDIADMVESTDATVISAVTQAEYDGLTPDASTLYLITDAT